MPVDKSYMMKILKPRQAPRVERRPTKIARVNVRPSTSEIVRAFRRAPGHEQILERIPQAATAGGWDKGTQVAYFSACSKSGDARYLDLWDTDHFDFFTDMAREVSDCRVWFSDSGYATWGSRQTKTGRINCYFNATAADYSCAVQLQSYGGSAQVECLIDNSSYGPLPFSGTILQPHFASLATGGHHFRIRQMSGAFFFLSLTIYRF
jgi:hypothetical protein